MQAHVIENEKIVNTIEVNDLGDLPGLHLIDAEIGGQIGDSYIDGQIVPAPTPTVIPEARKMTVLAFRNRFTTAEKVAIELAAVHDPGASESAKVHAATIRAYLADVAAAKFIEPDRQDTRAGVQAMEASGLIAAGRALEILDAPIQEHELP